MSNKLNILEESLSNHGFDAAALIPGANFAWLTGKAKELMERPTTLVICPGKIPALILPAFELDEYRKMDLPFDAFPFADDPSEWQKAFDKAASHLGLNGKRIAVEAVHFRVLEEKYLLNAAKNCQVDDGSAVFGKLRIRKFEDDLANMRGAIRIAQHALEETLKIVKPGITERELASELIIQMLRCGSQSTHLEDPNVVAGPNTADPHAKPGERPLQRGDFLLFDWEARYNGYSSDITRTFIIGEASDKQIEVYETVLRANRAALDAVRPGVTCGSIDAAGRDVINAAGYGSYFTHRIGHGLGMEGHEEPYMFPESLQILEEGMVFTDEPGIYLPGFGGVRIEDDIVVTASGGESLSDYPRALRILS